MMKRTMPTQRVRRYLKPAKVEETKQDDKLENKVTTKVSDNDISEFTGEEVKPAKPKPAPKTTPRKPRK